VRKCRNVINTVPSPKTMQLFSKFHNVTDLLLELRRR
jgi:hypothetical protein